MEIIIADGKIHPTQDGFWSVWGLRLLALVAILLAISLGYDWVQVFYRNVAVNNYLSFVAFDPPWMPIHTHTVAIIGNHYFGDFELPYGWALNVRDSLSPYLGSSIPANISPFEILFFVPFTLVSMKVATVLFLVISIVVFVLPIWLLLAPLVPSYRWIILALLVLTSGPFIAMLDRGNSIGIVIGLISWSVLAWRSKHWYVCAGLLILAVSLKIYPAVLLIVPIAFRRYRFAISVLVTSVFVNIAGLALMPGAFIKTLRVVVPSLMSMQLGTQNQLNSWGLYSIVPKFAGLFFGPTVANQFLSPSRAAVWIPSIAYLLGVFFIIRRGRVPQWCWAPLGLASIQLIIPQSGPYACGWASLGAIWYSANLIPFGSDFATCIGSSDMEYRVLRISLMLALTVSIVSSVWQMHGDKGFYVLATCLLSPTLLAVTLIISLVESVKPILKKPDSSDISVTLADVRG